MPCILQTQTICIAMSSVLQYLSVKTAIRDSLISEIFWAKKWLARSVQAKGGIARRDKLQLL
jgi:hypothetical protein